MLLIDDPLQQSTTIRAIIPAIGGGAGAAYTATMMSGKQHVRDLCGDQTQLHSQNDDGHDECDFVPQCVKPKDSQQFKDELPATNATTAVPPSSPSPTSPPKESAKPKYSFESWGRRKQSASGNTTTTNTNTNTNTGVYGDYDAPVSLQSIKSCVKSPLERLPMFTFPGRKKSDPTMDFSSAAAAAATKHRPRFVKSASIARLLGNTYCTQRKDASAPSAPAPIPRRFAAREKFQKCTQLENEINESPSTGEPQKESANVKALWMLTKGIGRLLRRQSGSVDISTPDPEFKVVYLGNVLTGWAKGDGCVEKPLNTLWRNYSQNAKPNVVMRVRVCPSGLKATTKQHGLTEYWSHRVTYCSAPKNYPRVFCWIYRHEGRKLRHEMRCHAVLCAKESIAQEICYTLQENLTRALHEFKRDKISRQNARLSLANSVYDNPSMPRRKILLSVGGNNYRPPLERSKSAPKLMAIEEMVGEEGEEEGDENDTAGRGDAATVMTASGTAGGTRRLEVAALRAHLQARQCCREDVLYPGAMTLGRRRCRRGHSLRRPAFVPRCLPIPDVATQQLDLDLDEMTTPSSPLDEPIAQDFELVGELMTYFDMKLRPTATLTGSLSDLRVSDTANTDDDNCSEDTVTAEPRLRATLSLDDLDTAFSDEEDDHHAARQPSAYFNQDEILALLQREAATASEESACSSVADEPKSLPLVCLVDSDEGSISSGCETASTVTNVQEEKSSSALPSPAAMRPVGIAPGRTRLRTVDSSTTTTTTTANRDDSDSEFSDESGYVEFTDANRVCRHKTTAAVVLV